jgi:hypothetical protein
VTPSLLENPGSSEIENALLSWLTNVIKYTKKAIPVYVEFAESPGVIETLEGPVSYQAGDALMTGVKGERWPIARKRFEETYYASAPGLPPGRSGHYLKKPVLVDAFQVDEPCEIPLPSGSGILHAKQGDWILHSADGHRWVVADEIFRINYQPVDAL